MIKITEKALSEIKRLMSSEKSSALRIAVLGGGCSGLSYKLSFDDEKPNDKIFDVGVKILIDPKSSLFLKDVELDFSDGLNGQGFIFNNPNAKKTCGCGTSFSV